MKSYQKLIIHAKYAIWQDAEYSKPEHIKYSDIQRYILWPSCLEILFVPKRKYHSEWEQKNGKWIEKWRFQYIKIPSLRIPNPDGKRLCQALQKTNKTFIDHTKQSQVESPSSTQLSLGF